MQEVQLSDPLDRKTIQTTEGVKPPKPGGTYFQRAKGAYKVVAPVTAAGASVFKLEKMQKSLQQNN
jgi:hypothetical protein